LTICALGKCARQTDPLGEFPPMGRFIFKTSKINQYGVSRSLNYEEKGNKITIK
jgi:hypothetical protein